MAEHKNADYLLAPIELNHNPREREIHADTNERANQGKERERKREVLVKQWIAPCVRQGFSLDDKEGTQAGYSWHSAGPAV